MVVKLKIVSWLKRIYGLSAQAYGQYKWQILALVGLGFLSGLAEGIGVNALIPLFSFILGDKEGGQDFISQQIANFFAFFNLDLSVGALLTLIAFLFLLKAVAVYVLERIRTHITTDYEEQTRRDLFQKFLNANWLYLLRQKLGHLETILMVDVPMSSNMLNQLSRGIMLITTLIIYCVIALNISVTITLVALAMGPIIFFSTQPIMWKIKDIAAKRVEANKETTHHMSENILGAKTVKIMRAESSVYAKGSELFKSLRDYSFKVPMLKLIAYVIIEPIAVVFIAILFYFYYKSPAFNLAAFVAIIYLIRSMFTYLQQLQGILHAINESSPHVGSILSYQKQAGTRREVNSGQSEFVFKKELEFRNVTFSYPDSQPILQNINFKIKHGELIGLIGPSGAGKTTLVDTLLRLLEPSHGEITLDGVNINQIDLTAWRESVGYVSQDIFLINDTVENNIRFYNQNLSRREVEEAAKMANMHDFIQTLPNKFDTIIGERGVLLSAGQRQRIVLARILARKPKMLILDEATSALDNESELMIQQVIKKLKGKITVLAIAHRLSTIMDSDRLIILEKGAVTEQDSPETLLANKDSYFYKVYNITQ